MAGYEENKDTDEMEQYGVWVKVQPEVIDESTVDLDEDLNSYQLSDIESDKTDDDFQLDNDYQLKEESIESEDLDIESFNTELEDNGLELDESDLSLETDLSGEDKLDFPEDAGDEISEDTELDFNIPEEEGLELPDEEELSLPDDTMMEFPEEEDLILSEEDNQTLDEEPALNLPEEDQLDIAEVPDINDMEAEMVSQDRQVKDSDSSDDFEDVSLDDFIEDGFSDPNKIDDDMHSESDDSDSQVIRDEDLADEITDDDLPDIDMDLKEMEEEVYLDESNFLDPKKIESEEIINKSLDDESFSDDSSLDNMLETEEVKLDDEDIEDFENITMPTAESEMDEINVDEIPDMDNEEGLQELELEMDNELGAVQDTEMTEFDAGNELDDLNLEDVSLELDETAASPELDEEMPEISADMDLDSSADTTLGQEAMSDVEFEDTNDLQAFEELDIEEDFAAGEDNKTDNENVEIEELALDDLSGDIGGETGEPEIEELILDEEFPDLNIEEESSDELDDMNTTDELVLNEELPDTLNENEDEFDHILDIDEDSGALKQKADSMEDMPELDLDGGLGLDDDFSDAGEISEDSAEMDDSFMDLEKDDSEVIEVSLSEEDNIDKGQFADFEEMADEMEVSPGMGAVEMPAAAAATGDLSLLQKIEKELNTIKNELSGLKTELAQLRKNKNMAMKPEASDAQGFFDEEEDETIALTGDELNNILNTADITEEMADEQDDSILEIQDMDSEMDEVSDGISLKEVPMDETWSETPEVDEMDIAEVSMDEMDEAPIDEIADEIVIDVPDEETGMDTGNIAEEEISLDMPGEEDVLARELTDGYTDLSTEELELDINQDELDEVPMQKIADDKKMDSIASIPDNLKNELKSVLAYMDQLLEALPEEKIKEFANSDYFNTYKKLFDELGLTN